MPDRGRDGRRRGHLFPEILAQALHLQDVGDGTLIATILGRFRLPPSYDNSIESGTASYCLDTANPQSPLAWPPAAGAADQRGPYFGSYWAYLSLPCADWRARDRDRYTGPFNRPTANPILVVGTTFDPATYYARRRYLIALTLPPPGTVCRPDFGPFDGA